MNKEEIEFEVRKLIYSKKMQDKWIEWGKEYEEEEEEEEEENEEEEEMEEEMEEESYWGDWTDEDPYSERSKHSK